LNGDKLTSTHAIGMYNTSSETSHLGDAGLKISSAYFIQHPQRDFPNFLPFFGHNFWTRNARMSINPSKDSYNNLVSNKISSQKIGPCRWHPGPDNLIQICINLLPLWCHQQKNKYLKL